MEVISGVGSTTGVFVGSDDDMDTSGNSGLGIPFSADAETGIREKQTATANMRQTAFFDIFFITTSCFSDKRVNKKACIFLQAFFTYILLFYIVTEVFSV